MFLFTRGVLDRLVPPTHTATTAGGGFPTQSQRRWWQWQQWRHYLRLDKTGKQPRNSRCSSVRVCPDPQQRAPAGGKGWQPAADGRGRTTARAHSVVFVGHMHASENECYPDLRNRLWLGVSAVWWVGFFDNTPLGDPAGFLHYTEDLTTSSLGWNARRGNPASAPKQPDS